MRPKMNVPMGMRPGVSMGRTRERALCTCDVVWVRKGSDSSRRRRPPTDPHQVAASEDRSWPWISSSYRQVSMQADRVRPGREGGREEGADGAVLEEASSFHRSISLSLARSESPFLLFHLHLPGTGMCH